MATFGNFVANQVLTAAELNAIGGAFTSYTPTLTNLSIGNGTVSAAWEQIGRQVTVKVQITLGSTSSVTGTIGVSLPTTSAAVVPPGLCNFGDASAGANYPGTILVGSTSRIDMYADLASGTYRQATATSSTVPFTWATSDYVQFLYVYEASS